MGKVSFRFLTALFSGLLWLFVFINYSGWSGAYINVSSGGTADWNNSYFGFESFMMMLRDLGQDNAGFFSVKNFNKHIQEFLDTCSAGLPYLMNALFSKTWDVGQLLVSLANLFLQPIMLIWRLLVLVGHVLYLILEFTKVVSFALAGYYNIPMDNFTTPTII